MNKNNSESHSFFVRLGISDKILSKKKAETLDIAFRKLYLCRVN